MATFVLVHGGWQGGWSWRRVILHLRADGHEVVAPTLTGLGERRHLLGCVEGLDTHVKDVLGVIEYEDLEDVVLVGHSQKTARVCSTSCRRREVRATEKRPGIRVKE
jgi:pimeloyl-ACP methyl ester carboxylesterase